MSGSCRQLLRCLRRLTVVGLLPCERQERTRFDGAGLATVGAVRLVGPKFADVDVCHASIIAPTTDIPGEQHGGRTTRSEQHRSVA